MLETHLNYVAGFLRSSKKAVHHFTKSETLKKFGMEVVKLTSCRIICTSSKDYTFKVNLKFDLKRNVTSLEYVGHDFKKVSKVNKYLTELTEAELECLHTFLRAETSIVGAEFALHKTFPGIMYGICFEHQINS
eukprot:snap_masked-scaffold_14-processed-gene-5.40-mRNA-1 protein AED:1.00 eAED:1.00 QI:0/0/0/0/1/1/2/0/133